MDLITVNFLKGINSQISVNQKLFRKAMDIYEIIEKLPENLLPATDTNRPKLYRINDIKAIKKLVSHLRGFAERNLTSKSLDAIISDDSFEYRLMKREKVDQNENLMLKLNLIDAELTMVISDFHACLVNAKKHFDQMGEKCEFKEITLAENSLNHAIGLINGKNEWSNFLKLDLSQILSNLESMKEITRKNKSIFDDNSKIYLDAHKIKLPFIYQELKLSEIIRNFVKIYFDSDIDFKSLEEKVKMIRDGLVESERNMKGISEKYTEVNYESELNKCKTLIIYVIFKFSC